MKSTLGLLAAVALATAGCGGGGGGGGGGGSSVDDAAIRATLATLEASMRAGGDTIDRTITTNAVGNPLRTPDDDTHTVDVAAGGQVDDGTVDDVFIATDATFAADGSGTVETVVSEGTTAGGFEFLTLTTQFGRPKISFRDFPRGYGYAGLDPVAGTGLAYILCRIERSLTITRTFANTASPSGDTLVATGAAPADGTDRLDATGTVEFMIQYEITGTGAAREANIGEFGDPFGNVLAEARSGTPGSRLQFRFSNASIDGQEGNANGDVVIPIGTDVDPNGFSNGDAITFTTEVRGGLDGLTPETEVHRAVLNDETFNVRTFTKTDFIDVSDVNVNNGVVDITGIVVDSESEQLPAGSLTHTLEGEFDNQPLDFEEVMFMRSVAQASNVFYIFY